MDEPELIYLNTRGSAKIVAVAIPNGRGDYPFFGAEVSDDQWSRYLREQVDLRYLILFPKYKRWYEFDLADFADAREIPMAHISFDGDRHSHLVPDVAFFARSHTSDVGMAELDQVTQSFSVDGAWNLSDFSGFYGKVSDVYSFFAGIKNWSNDDLSVDERRRVRTAFDHPWRGGFSYVAFFDDLYTAQPANDRLAVHSIQYASPGHVDVDGKLDVFEDLKESLARYGESPIEHKRLYNDVYKHLSQGRYLKMDARDFLATDPESRVFIDFSKNLGKCIGFNDVDGLLTLCQGNALVVLKIILAVIRRVDGLFLFFAEGRAKIPEEDVVMAPIQAFDDIEF